MKIVTTSDWHLGNLFHGNVRLPEHKHFLRWLLGRLEQLQPDALLVAGDVFDNGNPSADAQTAYYEFLAEATHRCPQLQVIITAGNHDSASRLEAPRPLLTRHQVEIRGTVHRQWVSTDEGGYWANDYDDLIIGLPNAEGEVEVAVLAVPYLRSEVSHGGSYSQGVNLFMRELTQRARELYPGVPTVMMAHMYAKGADIAEHDASEKIVIGGQEEVSIEGWTDHPDYLTCGHIHKRQRIWCTDWARYTGSVLPMSFAEVDYRHGVDVVTVSKGVKPTVEFVEYTPQHRLRVLPETDGRMTLRSLEKLIDTELRERPADGKLSDHFDYVALKVTLDKVDNDLTKRLMDRVNARDAVLCKMSRIIEPIGLPSLNGTQVIKSIDDVLERDPMDALKETFKIEKKKEMSERQINLLQTLLSNIKDETDD